MKRFMAIADTAPSDRLALYRSTILLQWVLACLVGWRCAARSVGLEELGLTTGDSRQVAWVTIALTCFLCLNQVIGLRRIARIPPEQRGSLFAITAKIMPRSNSEMLAYAALACTAGISEEFLYRGFVFTAFVRMFVNYGPPNALAAILSAGWFSLAHLYQGRRGIITTFVVGLIFATVRIWTGSLIPAVAAHVGIDLVAGICVSRFLRRA